MNKRASAYIQQHEQLGLVIGGTVGSTFQDPSAGTHHLLCSRCTNNEVPFQCHG